jgi:hypothetical protein
MDPSRGKAWRRFQTYFRRMGPCIFWRLGFRQSSFRHIARAPRCAVPYVWTRPPVSWHAVVPFTFRIQVSHSAQEPPFEFLPAMPGIQQGASWRTSSDPNSPGSPAPARVRMGPDGSARRPRGPAGPAAWSITPDPTRPGSGRSETAPPPGPGPAAPPPDHVPRSHSVPLQSRPARRGPIGDHLTGSRITRPGPACVARYPHPRPKIRTGRGEQPTAADHRG